MKARSTLSLFSCLFIFCFSGLLSVALFSSCNKNGQSAPIRSLMANTQSLLIDSVIGSTDSFRILATVPWTLTISPASATSWLKVSQTQGSSDATIRLTITGRNTNTAQQVTISVQAVNSTLPVQTVTLSQQGTLAIDSTYLNLQPASGRGTVHINTNLAWKAVAGASWVRLDTTQGAGPYALKISADTNRSGVGRSTRVAIGPVNNATVPPVQIQVDQYAYFIIYSASPASATVGSTITLKGIFPPSVNVYFTGIAATVTSHDTATIVCTVPQGAVGGAISVFENTPPGQFAKGASMPFVLKGGWNARAYRQAGLPGFGVGALVYTYNGSLYSGFGTQTPGSIYRFDTTTYQWTPDIPVPANVPAFSHPVSYIINNKLYVGGVAFNVSGSSFWEYDLTKGSSPSAWRQLTTPPDDLYSAYAFTQGGNGYLMTGQYTARGLGVNNLYRFSTTGAADPGTWTALSALGFQNAPASGFTIGGTTYFGGGGSLDATQVKAFYSITLPATTATPIASFPEPLNSYFNGAGSAWTIGNTGYVYSPTTGNIYTYDAGANTWTLFKQASVYGSAPYFAGAIGSRIFTWDLNGMSYEYIP